MLNTVRLNNFPRKWHIYPYVLRKNRKNWICYRHIKLHIAKIAFLLILFVDRFYYKYATIFKQDRIICAVIKACYFNLFCHVINLIFEKLSGKQYYREH